MKNFYFSYVADRNGKKYSQWNCFGENENLLDVIDRFNGLYATLVEFTVCQTKREAEQLTELRNQTFRQNGTHTDS